MIGDLPEKQKIRNFQTLARNCSFLSDVGTVHVYQDKYMSVSAEYMATGQNYLTKKFNFKLTTPRALRQPTVACGLRNVRSLEANPSQNGALTIPLPLRSHYTTTPPDTPHGPEVCELQQN